MHKYIKNIVIDHYNHFNLQDWLLGDAHSCVTFGFWQETNKEKTATSEM